MGGGEVEVVDVPQPELEAGTALLRIRAVGICGSDLHGYREDKAVPVPGYWWGHEAAGEVVELRPHPGETPRVKVGDLVTVDPTLGRACGTCEYCLQGAPVHCSRKRDDPDRSSNGASAGSAAAAEWQATDWTGCYADYAKRDVRGLFALPASMKALDGALVEPLAVSVHAVRRAGMKPGARVAVLGAGTIGVTAVLAAHALGASEVFVTARHPHQAGLARELGATHVLPETPAEAMTAVQDLTGGEGVDLVIETVGGEADVVNLSFDLVKRRGTVAFLGIFAHPMTVNMGRPLGREATVIFPLCYGYQEGRHDFEVAIDLIASGKARVQPMATHQFLLSQAPEAFRTADDKSTRSVKVLMLPE